ncbi:hypothetical protein EVAR_23228_1 [Eumeta japonica]|uniref:Uncharacterized protein n=1 Tax=Eumeta variegata TaxID=151549 RepID=A0A4C1VDN6_EUMVA|nr:hypothetical protein EVAR_23228_1 [Eumeta japonica]
MRTNKQKDNQVLFFGPEVIRFNSDLGRIGRWVFDLVQIKPPTPNFREHFNPLVPAFFNASAGGDRYQPSTRAGPA